MSIKLMSKLMVANSRYDFLINRYGHDAVSHTLTLLIDKLEQNLENMLHHIQTMSMLPWRRYASRWAPTSRMWMPC